MKGIQGKYIRSRKTWLEVVTNDMMGQGLSIADALDLHSWRRKILGNMCCPGLFPWDYSQDETAVTCVCACLAAI